MQEGQEIFTTKSNFLKRNYIAILGLSGIIFIIIGITIALLLDNQNRYFEVLVSLFSQVGMYLILASVLYFISIKVIEPLTDKTYKVPFHYEVIYFNDRLMFKRYTENGASESHQIFYPQINSLNPEEGSICFKLVFGILDDEIEEREDYDWIDKGNTTKEIENQKFRISKKLSKNDRTRLLDVLKIHIERAKAA
jgi:hypothetical protein